MYILSRCFTSLFVHTFSAMEKMQHGEILYESRFFPRCNGCTSFCSKRARSLHGANRSGSVAAMQSARLPATGQVARYWILDRNYFQYWRALIDQAQSQSQNSSFSESAINLDIWVRFGVLCLRALTGEEVELDFGQVEWFAPLTAVYDPFFRRA